MCMKMGKGSKGGYKSGMSGSKGGKSGGGKRCGGGFRYAR